MLNRTIGALVTLCLIASTASADTAEITRSITDIAAGADRGEWDRVRDAFAPNITTDYTSLWGGDPVKQPAEDLVKSWSNFLPGFDATHHMVTNHAIQMRDNGTATAEADFVATHRIGDRFWVLGGRYTYQLVITDEGRWVINALTMTAVWETGDRSLVQRAAERAAQRSSSE